MKVRRWAAVVSASVVLATGLGSGATAATAALADYCFPTQVYFVAGNKTVASLCVHNGGSGTRHRAVITLQHPNPVIGTEVWHSPWQPMGIHSIQRITNFPILNIGQQIE
ncbi:hypothetical protein [Rhizohabitans arisaemae]|uniref:hypothetical protein n=1 Tax=Rhizohabitans arisaemae TaxID=2720610 RepID=UPI0024B268B4|nr:hypothetical protein [Rhizohabitans arisaemae]